MLPYDWRWACGPPPRSHAILLILEAHRGLPHYLPDPDVTDTIAIRDATGVFLRSHAQLPSPHHLCLCVPADLLGRGIFVVDGQEWRVQRKAGAAIFSVRAFKDYCAHCFAHKAAKMCDRLDAAADSGLEVDMQVGCWRAGCSAAAVLQAR
jgi:hypothetical protein